MKLCGICHETTLEVDICPCCKAQRDRMTRNIKKKLKEKKKRKNNTQ